MSSREDAQEKPGLLQEALYLCHGDGSVGLQRSSGELLVASRKTLWCSRKLQGRLGLPPKPMGKVWMALEKIVGSTMKGLEMLQDLQVSRELDMSQHLLAKSTVATPQLGRVFTWQIRGLGLQITEAVIYHCLPAFHACGLQI